MKTLFIRCDTKSFYQGRVELRAVNLKRVADIDRLVFCVFDRDALSHTVQMRRVNVEHVAHNGESLCYAFCFTSADYVDVALTDKESERLAHVRNNRFFTETLKRVEVELSLTIEQAPKQRQTLEAYTVEELLAHLRQRLNAKITVEL